MTTRCAGSPAVTASPLGQGQSRAFQVAGVGGVPADATAVVLNVTAVGATKPTYVSAYPDLALQPTASNLNVANANAVPNLTVVPLGSNGKVRLYNNAGSVQLIGDISGYFSPSATSKLTSVAPCRVFDTRLGTGGCAGAATFPAVQVGQGQRLKVKVTGVGGVPDDATAVVLNVTAVNATTPTYVSVFPDAPALPTVSNLNVPNAKAVPNLTIVPVGPGGLVDLYNNAGSVDLIGDVSGYFATSGASQYTTVAPCRVFDTRTGGGACAGAASFTAGPVGQGGVLKVKVTGVGGVPSNATAVVLNVTATAATKTTYVSVYPDSPTQPTVSNLNVNSAAPVPNLTVVPVGPGGLVDLYNNAGTVQLIGDVAGYFAPPGPA